MNPANFIIAFVVVLVLIGAATWAVRRFAGDRLDAGARNRQPRLAVTDVAAVDGRRKLVIVRRDNVEHLLMIGGSSDVVVETNIVRGAGAVAREPTATREAPVRPATAADTLPRAIPLPDATPWPLAPEPAPAPAPAVAAPVLRAVRTPVLEEPPVWPDPEPPQAPPVAPPQRQVEPVVSIAPEIPRAPEKTVVRPAPKPEPTRAPLVAVTPVVAPPPVPTHMAAPEVRTAAAGDQSIAEMALRLEAALRGPLAQAPMPTPVVAPKAVAAAQAATTTGGAHTNGGGPKYSSLEQEMASLLGRPAGKA